MTAVARAATATLRVALVGNPNTGKSTLFNALTGLRQRAANFPGVTVERVEGHYRAADGRSVAMIDLPGCYSLSPHSIDETVAVDALTGRLAGVEPPDVVVVVVDAEQLERNLFLASQVIELGLPTIVALNRMDALESHGVEVDVVELIHELGVTVIPVVATRGAGVEQLRRAISIAPTLPRPRRMWALTPAAETALAPVAALLERGGAAPHVAALDALRLTSEVAAEIPDRGLRASVEQAREALDRAGIAAASLEAEARYRWIGGVVARTTRRQRAAVARSWSDRLDVVFMHRRWGPLIFVAVMALLFQAIFIGTRPLTDGIDALLGSISSGIEGMMPAGDLRSLLVDGVIAGVGAVLAFVPQIAVLFLFIGLLEDSGYMARAAFVMDRFLRPVGLHGRSFIPLVSGYACAVPAIMSARTIQDTRDRIATIMVVPLMSCSARLPVYALLIAAFVPPVAVAGILGLQGLTLFALYALGTIAAFGVAFVFRRTLLRGSMRPMIIELPPYAMPRMRTLLTAVWHRVRLFLVRAGTVIFALSIVLWALSAYPRVQRADGAAPTRQEQLEGSVLGRLGHSIEPAVAPLGYDWQIGVSLLSSFAAREVFVSTMATVHGTDDEDQGLRERLQQVRDPATGRPAYTPLIAIGLLLFFLFAPMCVSTLAIVVRETGGGRKGLAWAGAQAAVMFALAYGAALAVYQGGRALGLE